jgi:TatD family-associated radical SAM protein
MDSEQRKYFGCVKSLLKEVMSTARRKPSIVYWLGNNLYLNITNRCSNDCYFCFRRYKNGVGGFNLKLREEPTPTQTIEELKNIVNKGFWREIVFCGFGEPLARLDHVLEVTRWIKKNPSMIVRIDTNGQAYLLNKERNVIEELKEARVDRLSISLNAHDEETYNHVCKPKFKDAYKSVLKFIKEAKDKFDVEITTVTIPEVNIPRIREMARKFGVKFRLREYQPCFW